MRHAFEVFIRNPNGVTQRIRMDTAARLESIESLLAELEEALKIGRRWRRWDLEWLEGARFHAEREYRVAIEKLEGLLVARLFELTKMNKSGTGTHHIFLLYSS